MRDINLVKENVSSMINQGAPESDIDQYVASEGYTPEMLQGNQQPAAPIEPQAAPMQEVAPAPERSIPANVAMGLPQGLGNAAIGAFQAATDVGEKAASLIEKLYFGDNMGGTTFGDRLAERVRERKEQQAQLPMSERAGIFVGEAAPYLTTGAGTGAKVAAWTGSKIAGLAAGAKVAKAAQAAGKVAGLATTGLIGGTVASALSPQEQAGLENRAIETLKGGGTGLVLGAGLGTAFKVGQNVLPIAKIGLQKLIGVKPELAKAFQDAGVSPRLADISTSKPTKAFQNLLEVFPGSASTIQKATQNQIDEITKQLAGITKSSGGTIQETGTQIKRGAENFIKQSALRSEDLYNKVDNFVPATSPASLNNVLNAISDRKVQITAAVKGGTTEGYIKLINNLKANVPDGGYVPYDTLTAIRSDVGAALRDKALAPNEYAAINKIYKGLTDDIRDTLKSADIDKIGKESALKLWDRANASHGVRARFIEKNIDPIIEAKTPERVYQMAMSGIKQGGSNIKPIMRALNPTQQDFVRGSVVKNMGLQNTGLQDEAGAVFSSNKFLTEWSKLDNEMNREAVQNLFTKPQIESVRKLNAAISNIKETSKIAQKSNNLPYMNWLGLIGAVVASPVSAGQAVGAVVGARISAGMMTNPKFVNWLAQAPKVPTKEIPQHLRMLSIISAQDPDIREDVSDYIQSITIGSDAEAADLENMTEEQILSELGQRQKQEPILMEGMDIGEEARKINRRYGKRQEIATK